MGSKATDPTKRLGVYKRFNDVPPEHRLESYHKQYEDQDIWGKFLIEVLFPKHNSYRTQQQARLAGRRWRTVMSDQGRHHALARPVDVELWCTRLLEEVNLQTAYKTYWSKLERFYNWLLWHTDHPHRYNPMLMAAAEHESASEVWQTKMEDRSR